jgi:hypothetical protein
MKMAWKATKANPDMTYQDIAHGMTVFDAVLWLWRNGRLETRSAANGTHESVWGQRAMEYWRGRVELKTGRASAIPPASGLVYGVPSAIFDALKKKFGKKFEIFEFNPLRRRR